MPSPLSGPPDRNRRAGADGQRFGLGAALPFADALDRPDFAPRFALDRYGRKLPTVLSVEEAGRLLKAAPGPKYRAALGTAYVAGLWASGVATLKITAIDYTRMLIRIEKGKGRKDRNAMLLPQLLERL